MRYEGKNSHARNTHTSYVFFSTHQSFMLNSHTCHYRCVAVSLRPKDCENGEIIYSLKTIEVVILQFKHHCRANHMPTIYCCNKFQQWHSWMKHGETSVLSCHVSYSAKSRSKLLPLINVGYVKTDLNNEMCARKLYPLGIHQRLRNV